MLRILYVSAAAVRGGAETSLLELMRNLSLTADSTAINSFGQVSPLLVCPRPVDGGDCLANEAQKYGISVQYLALKRYARTYNPWQLGSIIRHIRLMRTEIAALVKRHNIDLIHANSPTAALQCAGAPIVCHFRDLRLPWLVPQFLRFRVSKWITPSQAGARMLWRWSGIKADVIANPVDVAPLLRMPSQVENLPAKLLMIGHYIPWKRHDLFLRCVAEVRARGYHVAAHIVGGNLPKSELIKSDNLKKAETGSYESTLRQLAFDLGLLANLFLEGWVSASDMPKHIASSWLLIHPTATEPFGRVLVEALACGVPVIAARGAGTEEILSQGGGILVEPDNYQALADAVCELLSDAEKSAQYSREGREIAVQYEPKRHVEAVLKVYSNVLDRKKSCQVKRAAER